MKKEELVCKNCGMTLNVGEDEIVECTFCNCKYKQKKTAEDEYELEPFIEFSNFAKDRKKEENTSESGEDRRDKSSGKKNIKKVALLCGGCACAAVLAIVLGINFDKRQEKMVQDKDVIQTTTATESTKMTEVLEETDDFKDSDMTDILPKSKLFKDFVSLALDKDISEITKEDMEEFKYIGILYNGEYDEIEIKYSFGDYYANDNSYNELMDSIYYSKNNRLSLSDLNYFTGLTELEIEYGEIQKGDISNLKKLRSYTGRETLKEISQILNPKQMWHLCLQGGADDLEGIEVYESLEELVINRGELTDISPITRLSNLYYLTLRDCENIEDFSPLQEMIGLESLEIQSDKLKNIDFVKDMPFLQYLEVTDSQIKSIEPLRDNTSIIFIELSENEELEDYSVLNTLLNLEVLMLDMGTSKATPDLSNLTNLRRLKLESTTDTDCLSSLSNLETLYLKYTNITNPSAISQMKNLVSLNMEQIRGEYENLGFLKGLTSLGYLDISHNEFYYDISDVFHIPNLERLYIDDCIFELDTQNIPELLSLKYFSMDDARMVENSIVETDGFMTNIYYDDVSFKDELEFLTKFPNLEYLELCGDELDSVDIFLPLTHLQCLVIDDNDIVSLAPLEVLEDLYLIYCADNEIEDYGNLKESAYVIE